GKLNGEKISDEKSGAVAFVGVGVADGLKLSVSLPYTFVQHEDGVKRDGFGDITLGARYIPTKSLVKLPFDAAVGIDWKTTSASTGEEDEGTGRNDYAPYLAVSRNYHTFIPYVKYQPEFIVKEHRGQTIHNLTAGAEIEFSHHYSLDVSVKASANGRSEGVKSSNDVEFEVVPYINVAKNLYLLPRVAYKIIGDQSTVDGLASIKDADEYTLGLGVYYLF
ncbi:MAG TPA: hypothetical protein VFF53_08005, partial [Geobacteraceae bacterium]|nr:hypothetical protein [Geobacteraceae bacterium]